MATRVEFVNLPGNMLRRIIRPRRPSAFYGYGQNAINGEAADAMVESEGPFESESDAVAWVMRRYDEANLRGQRVEDWWTETRDDGKWDAVIAYAVPVEEKVVAKKTSMLWLIVPTVAGIAVVTGVAVMAGGKKRGKK